MVSAWESLKADFTRVQIKIGTNIKKVLELGRETLEFSDNPQSCLTTKKWDTARNAEAHEKLKVELRDSKLKLEVMEDWKIWLRIQTRRVLLLC